jgi:Tol biopolymer transport system component
VIDVLGYHRTPASGTTRVSLSSTDAQGDGGSALPSISADGRFVAFVSTATNLVPGDSNGVADVFVRDRRSGTTQRVSVATGGSQANAASGGRPSISADGRYVAFVSFATDLVAGDTNAVSDVFLRDRTGGTTTRVSLAAANAQSAAASLSPSISADGRFVAFESGPLLAPGAGTSTDGVYVRDVRRATTERVSVPNTGTPSGAAAQPSISGDGRFVAFWSNSTTLVPGDGNGHPDVFVRDCD